MTEELKLIFDSKLGYNHILSEVKQWVETCTDQANVLGQFLNEQCKIVMTVMEANGILCGLIAMLSSSNPLKNKLVPIMEKYLPHIVQMSLNGQFAHRKELEKCHDIAKKNVLKLEKRKCVSVDCLTRLNDIVAASTATVFRASLHPDDIFHANKIISAMCAAMNQPPYEIEPTAHTILHSIASHGADNFTCEELPEALVASVILSSKIWSSKYGIVHSSLSMKGFVKAMANNSMLRKPHWCSNNSRYTSKEYFKKVLAKFELMGLESIGFNFDFNFATIFETSMIDRITKRLNLPSELKQEIEAILTHKSIGFSEVTVGSSARVLVMAAVLIACEQDPAADEYQQLQWIQSLNMNASSVNECREAMIAMGERWTREVLPVNEAIQAKIAAKMGVAAAGSSLENATHRSTERKHFGKRRSKACDKNSVGEDNVDSNVVNMLCSASAAASAMSSTTWMPPQYVPSVYEVDLPQPLSNSVLDEHSQFCHLARGAESCDQPEEDSEQACPVPEYDCDAPSDGTEVDAMTRFSNEKLDEHVHDVNDKQQLRSKGHTRRLDNAAVHRTRASAVPGRDDDNWVSRQRQTGTGSQSQSHGNTQLYAGASYRQAVNLAVNASVSKAREPHVRESLYHDRFQFNSTNNKYDAHTTGPTNKYSNSNESWRGSEDNWRASCKGDNDFHINNSRRKEDKGTYERGDEWEDNSQVSGDRFDTRDRDKGRLSNASDYAMCDSFDSTVHHDYYEQPQYYDQAHYYPHIQYQHSAGEREADERWRHEISSENFRTDRYNRNFDNQPASSVHYDQYLRGQQQLLNEQWQSDEHARLAAAQRQHHFVPPAPSQGYQDHEIYFNDMTWQAHVEAQRSRPTPSNNHMTEIRRLSSGSCESSSMQHHDSCHSHSHSQGKVQHSRSGSRPRPRSASSAYSVGVSRVSIATGGGDHDRSKSNNSTISSGRERERDRAGGGDTASSSRDQSRLAMLSTTHAQPYAMKASLARVHSADTAQLRAESSSLPRYQPGHGHTPVNAQDRRNLQPTNSDNNQRSVTRRVDLVQLHHNNDPRDADDNNNSNKNKNSNNLSGNSIYLHESDANEDINEHDYLVPAAADDDDANYANDNDDKLQDIVSEGEEHAREIEEDKSCPQTTSILEECLSFGYSLRHDDDVSDQDQDNDPVSPPSQPVVIVSRKRPTNPNNLRAAQKSLKG